MTDNDDVDRLSEQFNKCFETFEVEGGLFSEDAFFDLLPPLWRFQLQGPQAFVHQLRAIAEGPSTVQILRTVPTESGFVIEHEEHQDVGGKEIIARRMWLCEVRNGRIVAATGYCNGGWDDELRARHAAEAPMLRPHLA